MDPRAAALLRLEDVHHRREVHVGVDHLVALPGELEAREHDRLGEDQRSEAAARRAGLTVNFIHGDMREMQHQNEFDGAYCMFTSFGYFDEDTNRKVATNLAQALKPGGRLAASVWGPPAVVQMMAGGPILFDPTGEDNYTCLFYDWDQMQAMPEGGTLTVRAFASGDHVILEIADTGVGIPTSVDVLTPFTTTKASGSGLGLMIVRQIVSTHGGTLTYSSEPNKGTVFSLSFPVMQATSSLE